MVGSYACCLRRAFLSYSLLFSLEQEMKWKVEQCHQEVEKQEAGEIPP